MAEHGCNYTEALRAVTLTRIVDDPTWAPVDAARAWRATGRLQLFRQRDRASVLITQRPGDRGGSHVNSAEHYYRAVDQLCRQHGLTPPSRLYFNCIGVPAIAANGRDEVSLTHTDDGDVLFADARPLSEDLDNRLTAAGADWGVGDRPAAEPQPAQVNAWLVVPIDVIPEPHHLRRDLGRYLDVDWGAAQTAAIAAVRDGIDFFELDDAAQSLIVDPIHISGDRLGNGQHRTAAMRRQHVDHVLISAIRPASDPPLPHEIATDELD